MEKLALTAHEAADSLGVSYDTIKRLVAEGKLARVPHLGVIRIPVTSLRAFAEGEVAA